MVWLVAITGACSARQAPVERPAPPVITPPAARQEPPAAPPEPARPTEPAAPPAAAVVPAAIASPTPPVTVAPVPPATDTADCALIPGPGDAIATVALNERVDPAHAPRPANDSERLLFRQVYETLVRVDCEGHIAPGLAIAWRLDGNTRVWTLTLRDHARFSDGTPVTASAVRANWVVDGGDELRPHVRRLLLSVTVIDDRTIAIALRRGTPEGPMALAHTDLAIARRVPDVRWPLGTRADRAAARDDSQASSSATTIVVEREAQPAIRFLVATGDPRDLLDTGIDLLLTRDAAALAYAATLPQFQSVPLAWQRTLVLVSAGPALPASSITEQSRHAFAGDAVRGESRGAMGPFWWETLQDCPVPPPLMRDRPAFTPRVVYDSADHAARDVAERLVGLVRAPGTAAAMLDVLVPDRPRRTYQRTAPLAGEPLDRARRLGNDAGYLVALEGRPLDACRELQALTDALPWLDPRTIVPLVETRLRAIVRRGKTGVASEWDGGLQFPAAIRGQR